MMDSIIAGGNSSISLSRTSKGDYTWEMKLYFFGNDLRAIKAILARIGKARAILEHQLGQKVIPTEKMSNYLRSLEAEVENVVSSESAEDLAKRLQDERKAKAEK